MPDLPFFDDHGKPFPDACYLLYAAASSADLAAILTARDTLASGRQNRLMPGSAMYESTSKMILEVDELARQRFSRVVFEIGKAFLRDSKWISARTAIKRTVEVEMEQKKQSVNANIEQSVKKAFSNYCSVAHILAVWEWWRNEFAESEESIHALENCLTRAKFFEKMLD